MGRIKIVAIKTLGNEIMNSHGDKMSEDFDSNKKAIKEVRDIKSKKIRNMVAGYITREFSKAKDKA